MRVTPAKRLVRQPASEKSVSSTYFKRKTSKTPVMNRPKHCLPPSSRRSDNRDDTETAEAAMG